jgi:hypothetical protein
MFRCHRPTITAALPQNLIYILIVLVLLSLVSLISILRRVGRLSKDFVQNPGLWWKIRGNINFLRCVVFSPTANSQAGGPAHVVCPQPEDAPCCVDKNIGLRWSSRCSEGCGNDVLRGSGTGTGTGISACIARKQRPVILYCLIRRASRFTLLLAIETGRHSFPSNPWKIVW